MSARGLHSIAERLWEYRLSRDPYLRVRRGLPVTRISPDELDEAARDADFATSALSELRSLDTSALSHDDALTGRFLLEALSQQARAPELWWSQFPVTPYAASVLAVYLQTIFQAFKLSTPEDADRYLGVLRDYGRLVASMRTKLMHQAQRGWRIPQPALPGVVATLRGLRAAAAQALRLTDGRLKELSESLTKRVQDEVEAILRTEIEPPFDQLLASLDGDYPRAAPNTVGLSQYPGGESAYRALVLRHVTFDLDPERIHALGFEEVARLTEAMRAVRSSLGFQGNEHGFHQHLREIGRFYAATPEDVERRYRYHVERMAAAVPRLFAATPLARYDVTRLDASMEAGMSYGYYDPPTPSYPVGLYRYNGSGLDTRSQLSAAALIFHELVPGHHFHLARQAENAELPLIRREALDLTAFNEGWAEYASGLAREVGLYDDPFDWYGRLVHERFTAQRLVVDTGLNLLGWPLERARAYTKTHTLESDTQVASETLRYATDLPGQALAYRLGCLKLRELRDRAQSALGSEFDVRRFHEAVLGPGALPLTVLESHIDWFVAQPGAGSSGGGPDHRTRADG